jgi:hypothetical protein
MLLAPRTLSLFLAAACIACGHTNSNSAVRLPPQSPTSSASGPLSPKLVLPLEVDIQVAETFVRLGYALDRNQRFQSTEFLTPRLRTSQARHLIQLVKSYNEFEGEKVAKALAAFEGRVSGVEFGREGSPVIYVELPYWTHQREGTTPIGTGTRISDDENEKLIEELHKAFVGNLKADEFSVKRRRVRIWWD